MAKKLFKGSEIKAIANAIRAKKGITKQMKVADMAAEILDIAPAGEDLLKKDIAGEEYEYEVPASVTSIAGFAFMGSHIKKITIPNTVVGFGMEGFQFAECTSLTEVNLPSTINQILPSMFNNCANLTSITIPESVISIGIYAFYKAGLNSITLPSSVLSVQGDAFRFLPYLTSLTIQGSPTLGSYSFAKCSVLANVNLGNTTEIGTWCFMEDNALTEITLPETLTKIDANAFTGCVNLETVHVKATTPPTCGTTIFNGCKSNLAIYVPASSDHSILIAYRTTPGWSTYSSKIFEE